MIRNVYCSSRKACVIEMKLGFLREIFKKYSNIKFYDSPFSGSRVVPCGRTERQTDRQT